MEEAKLTVSVNGQYKNIKLSETKMNDELGIAVPVLIKDKYVIVEKLFSQLMEKTSNKFKNPDGTPKVSKYWIARAKYGDDEVSFFINKANEADAFNALGDVGDKIKIIGSLETYKDKPIQRFRFELV